jgi:hypothetical protein
MSRFFVTLWRFTDSKEDLFTECLAAALREDPAFTREYCVSIFGDAVADIKLLEADISIATQKNYPGCCLDMVLSLNGKVEVGMEHKLWSPEGKDQLDRYCALGLHSVAFITGHAAEIRDKVLANPVYRRPSNGRAHFLWSDFYDVVQKHARKPNAATLTRSLLELFDHLGFNPPHPQIGDLLDKENRRNFAKLWTPTKIALANRGWRQIMPGSIAELYVDEGRSARVARAWIDPTWVPGVLRVRLTSMEGVSRDDIARAVSGAPFVTNDVHVSAGVAARRVRNKEFVEVAIPLKVLFGDADNAEQMSNRLGEFVLSVFDAAC